MGGAEPGFGQADLFDRMCRNVDRMTACASVAMRLHISLDDEIVRALDVRVGRRQLTTFIAAAVQRALDDERRWEDIEGAIGDTEHAWDVDLAAWVREQRSADLRRVG